MLRQVSAPGQVFPAGKLKINVSFESFALPVEKWSAMVLVWCGGLPDDSRLGDRFQSPCVSSRIVTAFQLGASGR